MSYPLNGKWIENEKNYVLRWNYYSPILHTIIKFQWNLLKFEKFTRWQGWGWELWTLNLRWSKAQSQNFPSWGTLYPMDQFSQKSKFDNFFESCMVSFFKCIFCDFLLSCSKTVFSAAYRQIFSIQVVKCRKMMKLQFYISWILLFI